MLLFYWNRISKKKTLKNNIIISKRYNNLLKIPMSWDDNSYINIYSI